MKTKLYRLKNDAVQFFDDKHSKKVKPISYWFEIGVSIYALDEVEPIFITYGIRTSDISTSVSEWDSNGSTAKFHFTINAYDISLKEYNFLKEEKNIRDMMNNIQNEISNFIDEKLNK